jgi:hypothetical protein
MLSPKLIATFLIVLFAPFAKAETIDGPANFRATPKGMKLISLNDGVAVNCFKLENGWFKVTFTIKITKQQYDKEEREYTKGYAARAGEKLFDLHGKFIGIAIANIPDTLTNTQSYGDDRSGKSYQTEFFGYVAKANIKENSIPENTLDSLFKANTHLDYNTLKSFMWKEGYKNQHLIDKFLPKFSEYCIYESEDDSAGYRIGFVFENNELIAIEHSRALKFVNSKEYEILGRDKIFIIKPPASLSINEFIKKMNKAFEGAD